MARHNRAAPSLAIDEYVENFLADTVDIENGVITEILNKELHDIIQSLPDKFRIPIILYYWFETPLNEISKIISMHYDTKMSLGIPIGTIKSRLHKGRSLIKERLEERGYEYT